MEATVHIKASDMAYEEAIRIYVSTGHYKCPRTYDFKSYFSAAFECILTNIPKHEIVLTNEKVLRKKEIQYPIDRTNNITKAVNIAKIKDFVVIDTETTGLKPGGNDIIEVCAIKFVDFVPISKFHTYLKPRKSIPPDATAINHITDEMVRDAPTFSQIKKDLQNFIGKLPLVAHNAPFDMKFLHVSGLDLDAHTGKVYDTLYLSRLKLRDYTGEKFDNYRLATVCEEQNILCSNFHSASADALACGLVFLDIIRNIFELEDVKELLYGKPEAKRYISEGKTNHPNAIHTSEKDSCSSAAQSTGRKQVPQKSGSISNTIYRDDKINRPPAIQSNARKQRPERSVIAPHPLASSKSSITAIILCCLGFIGFCGLHRFYVGKIGSGLVNLFTCGMCWIWTIVDLVLLVTGNFTDSQGLKLK